MHVQAAAAAITVDEGKSLERMDGVLAPKGQRPAGGKPSDPPPPGKKIEAATVDSAASAVAMLRRNR